MANETQNVFIVNDLILDHEKTKTTIVQSLNTFYKNYIVDTYNGSFQVFTSLTYGEMLIAVLLFILVCLFCLKWVWEVLR
jgi:hypothetical protein